MSIEPRSADDIQIREQLDQVIGTLTHAELERMATSHPVVHSPDGRGRIPGRVLSIRGADVFVDIGGKSEGFLSLDEFEPDQPPTVGQSLSLVPHGFDRDSGLMRLSLFDVSQHTRLESVKVGDIVKARVTGSNIGGLELRIHGSRGFMPLSQIDLVRLDDLGHFIGHWLECEVVEVDRRGKNLVLSRRRLLERQRQAEREQLRQALAEGQVRKGRVTRLTDFGAFVDLGGVDGLLHVSDIRYGRLGKPSDVLTIGDEIEVKILKVDSAKDRISLGMKQLATDPWTLVSINYHAGQTIEGRVTKLADFGAFVEVEPGVEGLIPITELSWSQRVPHPGKVLKVGDSVRVAALSIDAEKRKLTLSLKALGPDPWTGVAERYPFDAEVSGRVTRVADFGAFIELEEGVEGLVHISQLSDRHVKRAADVVQPGQVVTVRVLGVDAEQRRISLTMKPRPRAAPPSPALEVAASAPAPAPKEKKRKRPLRGGLTW